ncbi:sensory histidine kinase CreC [compost metagenome]
MLLYRLTEINGTTICNSIPNELDAIVSSSTQSNQKFEYNNKFYRCIEKSKPPYKLKCITSDPDLVKSPKMLSKEADFILRSAESFKSAYNSSLNEAKTHVNRLVHNLVTLNAHNIQEVYSIIPQEIMQDKKNRWRERIVDQVTQDPYEASLSLVRVAKNSLKIKTEIDVYNTLLSGKPNITLRSHELHRVLMNVLYVFFPDFTDKGVRVEVSESQVRAPLDYETFQVAIYHLIENTAKYIRTDSILDIEILKDPSTKKTSITFKMNSLAIEQAEIDMIFEEGYSGSIAKKCQRSGSGIGLARVKELLSYNNAAITVEAKYETAKKAILEHVYQDNIFSINFN